MMEMCQIRPEEQDNSRRSEVSMIRTRLALVTALALGGSFGPAVIAAQDAGKVARIGYLAYSSSAFPLPDSFRKGVTSATSKGATS